MSNKENTSEEIDLGQLFKLIGEVFNRFLLFIENIFKRLFHCIIMFLRFIRVHFFKFVIAGVIGVAMGWYWDSVSEPIYRSSMIVEPNFNSAQQLYNNVEFYNELAEEKAYKTLASALKISDKEASSIKKVTIESYSDQTQKIRQFSEFIKELDTISQKEVDYQDYLKNFNDINSKFHKIEFKSSNAIVAKKCQNAIVRSIENNSYFSTRKTTNDLNIDLNERTIKDQLNQVDSLKQFYQELKLLELKKPENTSTTSINLASESKALDRSEITLLDRSKELSSEIRALNTRKANTENIINVISDFPNKGGLVNEFFAKKKVLLPLFLIGLTLLFLGVLSLNRYLKNYNS
ncbi:hypothetical protein [Aquimarina sp. Aq107]|uniref:hypothetical protein n=1 Tax=Aquimarina sp. Aq107 TaxID=1191912 RepID=UPI000D55DD26|nr:hypothetical protein [Aquimarina sp. Aq107]